MEIDRWSSLRPKIASGPLWRYSSRLLYTYIYVLLTDCYPPAKYLVNGSFEIVQAYPIP